MTKSLLSIHAKSFSWAGFFLPKNKYKDSSDLYDFCRTLDDIVDQDLLLNEKIKKFNHLKVTLRIKTLRMKISKKYIYLFKNLILIAKL